MFKKRLVCFPALCFNILTMMNDMMPTIEETVSLNDIAQWEHEQWLRVCEREDRWEALEAIHGPLLTKADLDAYHTDMAEIMAERDAAFENAFKCDEDDDEDAWADDDE